MDRHKTEALLWALAAFGLALILTAIYLIGA